MTYTKKILIVTGDAGESFEILYATHRLQEAGYEPVIAAPAVKRMNLVIHDFEPGSDTYTERKGYLVNPIFHLMMQMQMSTRPNFFLAKGA